MTKYLTPADKDAFLDFPPKRQKPEHMPDGHECPKCFGHGGWNLAINAYPLAPDMPNTRENRHSFSHFRTTCGACWGWGWTSDACPHEWKSGRKVGKCLHEWVCTLCGKTRVVDSSD